MSLLITRGFGDSDVVIETVYITVPICEPRISSHSWGEKPIQTEQVEDN